MIPRNRQAQRHPNRYLPAAMPDEPRALYYVPLLNMPWVDRLRMTPSQAEGLLTFATFAGAKAQALAWARKRVEAIEALEEG
jgi:hypothetical protein